MSGEKELKKAVKFRLDVREEEVNRLEREMEVYARAVNFLVKRCFSLLKDNVRLEKRQRYVGRCARCGEEATIVSNGSLGPLCSKCRREELGWPALRKRFIPSRTREVPPVDNAYLRAPLSPSQMDVAFTHAKQILTSWFRRERSRRARLSAMKERLKLWKEVLEGKNRVEIPPSGRQREPRYKHVNHPPEFRGKTLAQIRSTVERIEKRIRRLQREGSRPRFKGNVMLLKNTAVLFLDERRVRVTLGKERLECGFFSVQVRREKGRRYLGKAVKRVLEMQNEKGIRAYPLLIRKKDKYFLTFPLRYERTVPKPDASFGAVGVDRGVNALIAFAAINRPKGKPHHLWLASGRELRLIKKQRKALRDILYERAEKRRKSGERLRLTRIMKSIRWEAQLTRHIYHEIAKQVVERARMLYPDKRVVIVMEDLKHLRPVRGKKHERKLNYLLSNYPYRRLQQLIEYKAVEEGIPVAYVPPAHTSSTCSLCGHNDPENRRGGFFRCSKCGYSLNADLNAAINIANRFYELIQNP